MTRKAKAKPDPDKPDAYAHNGQSRKRGLNRSMMRAALGLVGRQLEYKARLAGRTLIEVNPAYTSQTCSKCGYCTKENRESQAVFVCKNCHARMNADTNAAVNILNRGERLLTGMDDARLTVSMSDTHAPAWGAGAMLVSEPQS